MVIPQKLFSIACLIFFFLPGQRSFASGKDILPHALPPAKVKYVENKNQWESIVRYKADFKGGEIFLEDSRFTYVFYNSDDMQSIHPHEGKQIDKIRLHSVRITPQNCNPHPIIKANDPEKHFNNYFLGNDRSRWSSNVRLFSSVTYEDLYPSISLKYYSTGNSPKYDLIVKPGGDASLIAFNYEGVDKLTIENGSLLLNLSVGIITEQKPYAYQLINGKEKKVECEFVLSGNQIGFRFPKGYDKNLPLIIDPTLVFSSYTGSGADNWGFTATYDAGGNLYSGGTAHAFGYPTTLGAYQLSYGGGGFGGNGWQCDMAIAKFDPAGTSLLYATYLGGSDNEQPQSIVVDGNNELIIFGTAYSLNFPVTIGAFQTALSGMGDMTISKLSINGDILQASTYVGGTLDDGLNIDPGFTTIGALKYNYSDEARGEIIVDPTNNDYIVSSCSKSTNFPVTPGAYQTTFGGGNQDGVIFKINSALNTMVWSTFLGGSIEDAVYDCVIDNTGDIYVAGGTNSPNFPTTPGVLNQLYQGGIADGFLTHLTGNASAILQSTFVGTSSYDQTYFVELDYAGNVYTTGQTEGAYPVTAGVYSNAGGKQFIHKLNNDLSTTSYSTVFGNGSTYPNISPTAFLVDTCENVYVAGWGRCLSQGAFTYGDVNGMPVTANAYQATTDGCDFYFFVLNKDAIALTYATFFGGNISSEHVDGGTSRFDKNGVIYESVCAGCGSNSDFPTTAGVVSNTNNSNNCNNGVIKLAFNLGKTVSSVTSSPASGCAPFLYAPINNSVNAIDFIWDFGDGSPVSNLFAPTHLYVDTGVYIVKLIALNNSSCNQNDTSFAIITVTSPTAPVASFNAFQNMICDTFLATTQYTGTGAQVCEWDFGDGDTATGTSTSHTYTDTGTYVIRMIARDTVCPGADTAYQTVSFRYSVNAVAAAAAVTNTCDPLSVDFSNASATNVSHFWDFRDGSPLDTNYNVTHVFASGGTYDVLFIITDMASCNISDTAIVSVTVAPLPPVIAAFNLVQSNSCAPYWADVSFAGSGGNVYHWDFGDGNTFDGLTNTHTYDSTGFYQITLTSLDSVCHDSSVAIQYVTFTPPANASLAAMGSVTGCAPFVAQFNNTSTTSGVHFWNFMDNSPIDTSMSPTHIFNTDGVFDVMFVISDPASCNGGDTAIVRITVPYSPPLLADFADVTSTICDSLWTIVNFNGTGGNLYHWDFGDGFITDGLNLTHYYDSAGTYTITLSVEDTVCDRTDDAYRTIEFLPTVHAGVNTNNVLFGCTPQTVSLTNTFPSIGNYMWNMGDGFYSSLPSITHTYNTPGTYNISLRVDDSTSCNIADTAFYTLDVYPGTIADFEFVQNATYFFSDVYFVDRSVNAAYYMWNFGDDSPVSSSDSTVIHRFDRGGDYEVCLYVMTTFGCLDTMCEPIHVEYSDAIYVPNSFTPNGDGVNDFFKVYSIGLTNLDVSIYDRWGVKIYEYNTIDGKWDGLYKGSPVQEDTYVYRITAASHEHPDIVRLGKVTVVR